MATLYFNGAIDDDWNNLNNWWTDSNHSIAATSLPTNNDNVIISATIGANNGSNPTVTNMTMNGDAQLYIVVISVTNLCTFNESSWNYSGTINGNCVFNNSSRNSGTINGNATFTASSFSNDPTGTITGTITFSSLTPVTFTPPIWDVNTENWIFSTPGQNWIFNDSAYNNGTIVGDCIFNENSFLDEGTITGNCIFNDTSRHDNIGSIIGNCIFNDNSFLFALVDGNCVFNNNATFRGESSFNIVTGSITFNNNSKNITNITADNIVVNRKSLGINNSNILGMSYPNPMVLLLHFDNSLIDDSPNNYNIILNGNAELSSADSKFGSGSVYFDGTTSTKLSIPTKLEHTHFGYEDFTIEAWVKIDDTICDTDGPCIVEIGSHSGLSANGIIFMVGYRADNWIAWGWLGSSTDSFGALPYTTNFITPGIWTHIALTRSGNTFRIFINGILGSTDTRNANIIGSNNIIHIGGSANNASANEFGGYIDEVRIIKGKSLYTANFTPPTGAFES